MAEGNNVTSEREQDGDMQYSDLMYMAQKEAILFLIDVSTTMLATDGDSSQNTVKYAIECAYRFLTYKIIANPNDMVGILLYGTKSTSCPDEYGYTSCSNVFLLADMEPPNATRMKAIRDVVSDDQKFDEICSPAVDAPTLTNVLFLANGIFSQQAPNFNYKRIMLITDNDDPHNSDKAIRQSAITRARDLNDLGIKIEPIFVSTTKKPFLSRKFYDDIVFIDDGEPDENLDLVEEGAGRLQQMMDRIKAKASPKRAIFSIPLEIGPGVSIGVKGYIIYKEQKISKSAYIYNLGENPQFAKAETTNICVDTSKALEKEEIKKGFKFGDESVCFAEDELKRIKHVEDPVLRLIGFKDMRNLQFWHNLRPAYFIYPHEATVVGSTRVFAALHHNLIEKKKWALGWFIPRKNANPNMVAMVASKELVNKESRLQVQPPGIFLITLPFADDIRSDPQVPLVRSPDTLIESMNEIIRHLTVADYDPLKYQNPALQWHWRTLQALALEEDMPETQVDGTEPKYKGIEKRAGHLIQQWQEAYAGLTQKIMGGTMINKRLGEAQSMALASKRQKSSVGTTTVEDLVRAMEEDHLDKLTLPLLKQVIKDNPESFRGRPASQKKSDLVLFIKQSLSQ